MKNDILARLPLAARFLQSRIVVRVGGVEGEAFGDGGGCDHQVGYPPAWLAARRDHGGGYPTQALARIIAVA